MKKHTSTLAVVLLALGTVIGMSATVTAADSNNTETSEVTVNITTETALDVKPDTLTYNDVSVGDRVEVSSNDHGYETIKIENTGSQEIREIWASSELPTNNPFGSADEAGTGNHISTNFLQIKPESGVGIQGDSSTFHYVERAEFFQDSAPLVEYNLGEFGAGSYDNSSVGRIRTGNNEFYFVLGYTGNSCNAAELRVADTPTTPDSLGTTDFRDSNSGDWTAYAISSYSDGSDGYGITNTSVGLDLTSAVADLGADETQTYDILAKCSNLASSEGIAEPHILLNKYDIEAGAASDLFDGDGTTTTQIYREEGTDLAPGSSFGVDVAVQVPRGVPAGTLTSGTLTLYSQAAYLN